jgi:hypothetical protein
MVIKRKKLLMFKSIEEFVKEFPDAKQFIDENAGFYQEYALGNGDSLTLQLIITQYLKEGKNHYVVFAHPEAVVLIQLEMQFTMIVNGEIQVYYSKEHMEQAYTDKVFNHYIFDPHVRTIDKKLHTFSMAMDIQKKLKTFDIKILDKA